MLIAEEFTLLAISAESGKPHLRNVSLRPALCAAVLTELILRERLGVTAADLSWTKRERLTLLLDASMQDRILDEAFEDAKRFIGKRPRDVISRWNTYGRGKKMQGQLLDRLIAAKILGYDEERVAGIFPSKRYPELDPGPEREVRARINAALLGADPDPRTAVLISLLLATKVLPKVISAETDKRAATKRAKEITEGEWAGAMVKQALDQIKAGSAVAATS